MKGNEKIKLQPGDEIGFVTLGQTADEQDAIRFYTIIDVCERDGERAYRYQFPDGAVSRSSIRQSDLASHVFRVRRNVAAPERDYLPVATFRPANQSATAPKQERKRIPVNAFDVFKAEQRARAMGWFGEIEDLGIDESRARFYEVLSSSGARYDLRLYPDNTVSCNCLDFVWRERICKHAAAVVRYQAANLQAVAA